MEMSRRFFKDYVAYLKKGFEDSWKKHIDEFPTTLIKCIDGHKKLKSNSDFTLGSVSYVLCATPDASANEAQAENNRNQLLNFLKDELLTEEYLDNDILGLMEKYGRKIEDITKRFRNKAAHSNDLSRVDADECFQMVIDVEKILKKLMDMFRY